MSLTMLLSGPKSSVPQARNALAASGFQSPETGHDHGMPVEAGEGFLHVLGDDLDAAVEVVQPLGFRLRLHHATPPAAKPSAEQLIAEELARLRAEIDDLKGRVR